MTLILLELDDRRPDVMLGVSHHGPAGHAELGPSDAVAA
jgi:hypothetical protein